MGNVSCEHCAAVPSAEAELKPGEHAQTGSSAGDEDDTTSSEKMTREEDGPTSTLGAQGQGPAIPDQIAEVQSPQPPKKAQSSRKREAQRESPAVNGVRRHDSANSSCSEADRIRKRNSALEMHFGLREGSLLVTEESLEELRKRQRMKKRNSCSRCLFLT